MATEVHRQYCFGPYRLDREAHVLLRDGEPVSVTPKVFDALLLLVESGGRLVGKDELMKALWGDAFVTEANLTQTIFMLRKALGDTGDGQQYVVNVPGRGYRFAMPVAPRGGNGQAGPVADTLAPAPMAPVAAAVPLRRLLPLALGVAIIAVTVAYMLWANLRRTVQPAAGRKVVVAVLPFENLTGDPGQDYFIDGLTAEIIVQLGQVDPRHVGVITRTSVIRYKKIPEQVQRIGRDLGVDYVLEGNVRRGPGKLRITADLIHAADQTDVWSREYDREANSSLAVQSEIARLVADDIEVSLGNEPVKAARRAPSSPARDLYLKGRYFWNKRTASGFTHAVGLFQQAIAKDPNFAPAYAGLADCYSLISSYSIAGPPKEVMAKARSAARRALELDNNSAEAHTSLALILENYDWDWQGAEKEFRRAIELDPQYSTAHHWYAEYLAFQGRFDEALAESDRGHQLDPLSLIIAADHAAILNFAGKYDRAIQELQVVLDMEPSFPRAHGLLIGAFVEQGQFTKALAEAESLRTLDDNPWTWTWEGYVYGRMNRRAQAQQIMQRIRNAKVPDLDPEPLIAIVASAMGDTDVAFAILEKQYAQRSQAMVTLKVEHNYDRLRRDPRFQDLLHRVGLSE